MFSITPFEREHGAESHLGDDGAAGTAAGTAVGTVAGTAVHDSVQRRLFRQPYGLSKLKNIDSENNSEDQEEDITNEDKSENHSPVPIVNVKNKQKENVLMEENNKNVSQMFLYQNHIAFTIIAIFSEILPDFHEKISHFWVGKFLNFDFKLSKSLPGKSI